MEDATRFHLIRSSSNSSSLRGRIFHAINLVCARLQRQHRKADALQVIEDFLLLRSRFKALCRRWGQSRRYRCLDYGYCLLRKVDKDIELQIRSGVRFKHLSLQDLVERIKAIHRARQLVRDAEPAVHATSPTPPQEHDAAHHSDRLAKWCDSKEHISFICPTKPVCPNCNKGGHFQDDCLQITRKGPLGTRQAFLRREPGGSFKLCIDDIKNNRALLRTLANIYNEKSTTRRNPATTTMPSSVAERKRDAPCFFNKLNSRPIVVAMRSQTSNRWCTFIFRRCF
ncbi:zinc knuckle protein [Gregarina niphandrodes]|uniref:Zinc knuckle protein n=1 Tax=Gregarina niphandrodes TaxID=110365 RepID=A0A023B424_GRENI|nr:zinc knuckle protein [Gregarina niphandrodes]EZG56278.1 zinc knuckle protein [Gregarina niphandrodes]|eukprot:XP_011131300.1 zinc knuckle protein [Gregarina niphandrodes]